MLRPSIGWAASPMGVSGLTIGGTGAPRKKKMTTYVQAKTEDGDVRTELTLRYLSVVDSIHTYKLRGATPYMYAIFKGYVRTYLQV